MKSSLPPAGSTIAVAMSGGVDSSVTAALLIEQGYTVFGLTMNVIPKYVSDSFPVSSQPAITDARSVADQLGIRHYVVDVSEVFDQEIIDPFCREYLNGRTPNPCIHCNRLIKFSALMNAALEHGASYLATGHYVRIIHGSPCRLMKGVDTAKDQSYFLARLTQDQLRRIITPLGGLRKNDVRGIASRFKLSISKKPESQEICFLPDGAYAEFVSQRHPDQTSPGPIIDREGKHIGTHKGLPHYTIGQRRNLGVALGRPQYVTRIDPDANAIHIGDNDDLTGSRVSASAPNWIIPPDQIHGSVLARLRYRHTESPGTIISSDENKIVFEFDEPQRAITPGQQLVLYVGEEVIGSGTID